MVYGRLTAWPGRPPCRGSPRHDEALAQATYDAAFAPAFLFCRLFTRSSTTVGSASVEVSPRLPYSSSAILRRMRRMILPERVFGRPGANWIRSGEAIDRKS